MYADINGLRMVYEIHGTPQTSTVPLVLLYGAMSATGSSFGSLPGRLAVTRRVITIEQQGHGRTADIDRPLSVSAMAEDTLALLAHLHINRADLVGYSLGAGITLRIITTQPDLVRRAVLASVSFDRGGLHPQLFQPPAVQSDGSPGEDLQRRFREEYQALAPDPGNWSSLVKKVGEMELPSLPPATVETIGTPILLVIGDSDIVTPEHAIAMFRMLGGGALGDLASMAATRLAVLPGTSHIGMTERADLLMAMIPPFLDAT